MRSTRGARGALPRLADLEDKYRTLLEGQVTCTLATMMPSGRPQLTPIWVAHDGTHILVNTKKGRVKDDNMRTRPQVSIMAVNPENPYHWMTINGSVVDMIEETDPERGHEATTNVNALSKRYIDQDPYPLRDPRGEVAGAVQGTAGIHHDVRAAAELRLDGAPRGLAAFVARAAPLGFPPSGISGYDYLAKASQGN